MELGEESDAKSITRKLREKRADHQSIGTGKKKGERPQSANECATSKFLSGRATLKFGVVQFVLDSVVTSS